MSNFLNLNNIKRDNLKKQHTIETFKLKIF